MVEMITHPSRSELSRRELFQLGGLGILGITLLQLLQAESQPRSRPRSCIFVVQYGEASHLDGLDRNPEAEIRGPYSPIASAVPGMQLCELLPRLSHIADQFMLIRLMTNGNFGNDGGMHVCMTRDTVLHPNTQQN